MPESSEPLDVPQPPQGWEETQPWLTDHYATSENDRFQALDEVEKRRRKSKQNVHSVLSWCIPASVALAFALFWAGIAIYAWNLFVPVSWQWLTPEQQKELHTILFSGAVGAIVSQGAKRYLE